MIINRTATNNVKYNRYSSALVEHLTAIRHALGTSRYTRAYVQKLKEKDQCPMKSTPSDKP